MADTPTPRSYPQTLGDMFDAFLSKQGVRSLRVGGPIVSILEAAAQSDLRNAQDIFNLLTSVDLDNATGLALARIGNQEGVRKLEVSPASGLVTISDSSFTRIATKLFQGSPAPIVGSVVIEVVDASLFPAPGADTKIYLGRGTSNYEGPIRYTSVVNVGNHWEVTLATGTTKFHNQSETVILSQGGNRVIGPNTVVQTAQASTASAVSFNTLFQKNLPDGETTLPNVEVVAQVSGNVGNVIANSVTGFSQAPFDGATVTNPSPFTNGRETESDNDYRERIRNVRANRQLGTSTAITTAVTGITAPDENKRVNSASLVKRFGFPATLYIDDGTGYEESTAAIAIESFIDTAVGGETHFEATQRPIARAFAISTNVAPFVLRPTDQLTIKIGGVTYTHAFNASDFHSITNASAFEVVSSINSNPDVAFVARTANRGTQVAVFANADVNEDIEVVTNSGGTDANDGLRFPAGVNYTMRLYKNDRLLSKDGESALIQSLPIASWNSVTGNQTLVLAIDNTPSITYEFTDLDFVNANTGYATLGRNSLAAWAAVINAKVPGITATVNAGRVVLTSNAGPVAKAAVEIIGGDLVTAHFFPVGKVHGRPRDYTLDRNEAQVVLAHVLEAGDRLTAGSFATRAFAESGSMETIDLALDAHLWWLVDGAAKIVPHGLTSTTPLSFGTLKVEDYGNVYKISSSPTAAFSNVQSQDWVVLWDDAIPVTIQGTHRVASVDPDGKFFTIERHSASLTMRQGHRSVLIPGVGTNAGKVFTCGGNIKSRSDVGFTGSFDHHGNIATAEIYDHNTRTVVPAHAMSVARANHTATALANGKVVVTGGVDSNLVTLNSIETYDPGTDSWTTSAVTLTTPRQLHTATLLTDGRILIVGGYNTVTAVGSFQIYDPSGDTVNAEQPLVTARLRHAAVLLPDNTVLISGGYDSGGSPTADCERFTPGPDTSASTGSMTVARAEHGLATVGLTPTTVMAVGASSQLLTDQDTWEEYDIGAGTWGNYNSAPDLRFAAKGIVRLTDGQVVGLNAWNGSDPTQSCGFKYNGSVFSFLTEQPPSATDLGGPRFDTQLVEIKSGDGTTIKNIVASIGGCFYQGSSFSMEPTAVFETYDEPIFTWSAPDPADATGVELSDLGIAFVRSNAFVQVTTVPAGTNYTASSLADVFDAQLVGAYASVYKTTKLRVSTNTFDASGDISLVTHDVNAAPITLSAGDAIANLVPHLGSVKSGNSDLGTPSFEDVRVISQQSGTDHSQPVVTSILVGHDYAIAGLKNWARGGDGSSAYHPDQWNQERANSNYKFSTRLKGRVTNTTMVSTLDTRDAPPQTWGPWDRVMAAAPFAISPNGNLDVLVDNDQDKRYPVNFWRVLQPIGNTYASTNGFKDADANFEALSETFGLDYDFNDFAIYMPSRALALGLDANRRLLFRFFRLGPDGDGALVRFGNPDAESSALSVVTAQLASAGKFATTIKLKSGALRSPTVHNTTQMGKAVTAVSVGGTATYVNVLNLPIASAARVSGTTTYTLTLPATITDHGIAVNAKVWVNSSDPNFPSGLKLITAVTGTTIDCLEALPDATGTTIGTLSYDSQGEATFTGSGAVQYDFLRLNNPNAAYAGITFQISSVAVDGGSVGTLSGDQQLGHFESPSTVLSWSPIGSVDQFKLFANAPQTVTQIVAAINALRAVEGSTCPITATSTGTGSGSIVQNTCDELDEDLFWYELSDGINWVKTTTSPGFVPGDYTLDFKAPIDADLSANADWENETVRIVPITAKNIVGWLNTPTVTGLWTVADVEEAGEGHHVEISTLTPGSAGGVSVLGGLANSVTAPVVGTPITWSGFTGNTVAARDADALTTGMWCRIQNENPQPKQGALTTASLVSWTADGLVTMGTPIANQVVAPIAVVAQFEKQGNFVAIADTGSHASPFAFYFPVAGSWIRITPAGSITDVDQVQAANQGLFRVVRYVPSVNGNGGTIFIENPNVIEETSACQFEMYDSGSVMPGDQLVVLSNDWGAGNVGIWDIKTMGETSPGSGDAFSVLTQFTVDVTSRRPIPHGTAPALDGSFKIYVREGLPMVYVMRVDGLTLNQDDGNFIDIRWDSQTNSSPISEAAGSIIQVQDKLAFPQDFAAGSDGYRYDIGLLREANKIVYGDPGNPATYPGVAAADAHINIQGPLVKRIQIGVSIRVKTGLNTQDIANRVRSAIATVVNQTLIGQSISFSDIIDAAREVVGVVSVAIVSPLFSVESDQIKVQPYEKPFILDLTQDVQVSFLGV